MTALPKIGLLVSRYPAVSHTFILREVAALRGRGGDIDVASINEPDRPAPELTADEKREAGTTWYVKKAGFLSAMSAITAVMVRHPVRFAKTFHDAVSLSPGGFRSTALWLAYLAEAALVARWIRRRRVSHLHIHFATEVASVGLLAARLADTPFSLSVHGPTEFFDVTRFRLAEKIRQARFIRCISDFTRAQVLRFLPAVRHDAAFVAPLGVDVGAIAVAPIRDRPVPFRLLCVGRLSVDKGHPVLLRAAARLLATGRTVSLNLVGEGPERAALESLARELGLGDRVHFLGALNADVTDRLYAESDAFALASFAEGLPVVLMEAMAHGVPCVATCINGIPELIRDGRDGLLVPAGNDVLFAEAIDRVIGDADLRRRLGISARERVAACHDLAVNTDALMVQFQGRLAR